MQFIGLQREVIFTDGVYILFTCDGDKALYNVLHISERLRVAMFCTNCNVQWDWYNVRMCIQACSLRQFVAITRANMKSSVPSAVGRNVITVHQNIINMTHD